MKRSLAKIVKTESLQHCRAEIERYKNQIPSKFLELLQNIIDIGGLKTLNKYGFNENENSLRKKMLRSSDGFYDCWYSDYLEKFGYIDCQGSGWENLFLRCIFDVIRGVVDGSGDDWIFRAVLHELTTEGVVSTAENKELGIKHDKNKLRWDLLPFDVLHDVIRVFEHGEKSYGKNNWQNIENAHERLWRAAFRHLIAAQKNTGELDNETNLPHLAHCIVNLIFLMWYNKKGK